MRTSRVYVLKSVGGLFKVGNAQDVAARAAVLGVQPSGIVYSTGPILEAIRVELCAHRLMRGAGMHATAEWFQGECGAVVGCVKQALDIIGGLQLPLDYFDRADRQTRHITGPIDAGTLRALDAARMLEPDVPTRAEMQRRVLARWAAANPPPRDFPHDREPDKDLIALEDSGNPHRSKKPKGVKTCAVP